jgi:N-acetylglutamate synthase-like GNAT family acetyltransferase
MRNHYETSSKPSYTLRPATSADAALIRRLIREASLNPFGLNWQRFLVAEQDGQVVGIGQIKPHRDGSRELASIAVVPSFHGQGVGTLIIEALLARESAPLYLMCRSPLEMYYHRFGFTRLEVEAMPPYFKRICSVARLLRPLLVRFTGETGPVIMRRP